jgi:hypothetical protein
MYFDKQPLIDLYVDFMNRMDDDLKVAADFNGPLTDDYLEGMHTGMRVAQDVFRQCYKKACSR